MYGIETYELLSKYIDGSITQLELQRMNVIIEQMDDEELSLILSNLWSGYQGSTEDKVLLRDMFKNIKRRTRKGRSIRLFAKLSRVAAVLVPLICVMYIYSHRTIPETKPGQGRLTVFAERGERAGIVLPDGTNVKLNAESSLSYAPDFGKEFRAVELRGEAYFIVAKKEGTPFVVHTQNIDIEVLGTVFNVYSYENEAQIELSLMAGSVKVADCANPANIVYLKPNEKVLIDKVSGKMRVEKTDNRFETAWVKGDLVFRSMKLCDVFKKLERRYGVRILVDENSLDNDLFTGNFNAEYAIEVIEILKQHYGFIYTVQDNEIHIKIRDGK